jgi:hypothetical protein
VFVALAGHLTLGDAVQFSVDGIKERFGGARITASDDLEDPGDVASGDAIGRHDRENSAAGSAAAGFEIGVP